MALYTAGITVTPTGGSLVVVQTCPRKIGRKKVAHGFFEDDFEDILRVVAAERLSGTIPETATHIGRRLQSPPIKDDVRSRIELSAMGTAILRPLRAAHVHPWPALVGTEQAGIDRFNAEVIPATELQGVITLLMQSGRIEVLSSLLEGTTLLSGLAELDGLPPSGPLRDITIAASLAIWTANRSPSRDGWASNRPNPRKAELDEMRYQRRRAIERVEEARDKGGLAAALAARIGAR